MSPLIGPTTGGLGLGRRSPSVEERTEMERPLGIAALIGTAVRRLCILLGASILEQRPKTCSGGAMSALIGATVSRLRSAQVPLLLEQLATTELGRGNAALIRMTHSRWVSRWTAHAPRHSR